QGLLRHVPFAEEGAGGVAAGHRVEGDAARAALARRAWFVEADVPGSADAQDLQVDASRASDLLFVLSAEFIRLIGAETAVRNVNVLRLDVDMVEERFLHPAPVALRIVRLHRVVFVEVERDNA